MAALSDDPAMLPSSSTGTPSAEASRGPIDVLVSETAQRIGDVIDSFERKFNERHGAWPISAGCFEFGLQAQSYNLVLVPDG